MTTKEKDATRDAPPDLAEFTKLLDAVENAAYRFERIDSNANRDKLDSHRDALLSAISSLARERDAAVSRANERARDANRIIEASREAHDAAESSAARLRERAQAVVDGVVTMQGAALIDALRAALRAESDEGAATSIRPEVLAFARVMSAKIDGHNHDRGEHGWRTATPIDLLDWLHRYFGDLQAAARAFAFRGETDARPRVLSKAANVANLAMMIADVCGGLRAESDPIPTTPTADALRDVRDNLDSLLRGVQNGHFGPPDEEFTRRVAAAFAALRWIAAPSPEAKPPAGEMEALLFLADLDRAEAKPPATTREPAPGKVGK